MDRQKFNVMIIAGAMGVALFVIGIKQMNRVLDEQAVRQMPGLRNELPEEQEEDSQKNHQPVEPHPLAATDLAPYQITPQRKSNLFKNQQYWDVLTKESFEQSDAETRIHQGNILGGITRTPEEYKKEIRLIDGRIKEYKQRIRQDPNNEYAKKKLQDLYMLKSTVRVLKENLVPEYRK